MGQIAEAYDQDEDKEIHDRMMALRSDPLRFLAELELQGITLDAGHQEIAVEYLTPWDPEHTRTLKMTFGFETTACRLTCGME